MPNIMQCIIGKDLVEPRWNIKFSSPFVKDSNFSWEMSDFIVPYPAKIFEKKEVEEFRDYLTSIIDEYDRIVKELGELNV